MTGLSCSDGSLAVAEPLAGTSPEAVSWVALEQSGPWGARAFVQSHLDPDLGAAIEDTAARHGVRPALVRRPGRHADGHTGSEARQVLVAHTRPGRTWLLVGTVPRPEAVLELNWAAVAAGDRESVRRSLPTLRPEPDPVLLVCTNGRRDVCCAVKGRPVALDADAAFPGRIWEVTHTSGHRFAPTAVLLPAGILHGRLDSEAAVELLEAADDGLTLLPGSRGRSTWPAPAQAAELAVRELAGVLGLDELEVTTAQPAGDRRWRCEVRHLDGRIWHVLVEARESERTRAESCAKALKPMQWFSEVRTTDVA